MSQKRKLIVTGAHGFVAGSVLAQAGPEWEVHAVSRRLAPAGIEPVVWHACEPIGSKGLSDLFSQIRPAALIHTAAIADIDFAEENQSLTNAVNVQMTRDLANQCAASGCKFVFCSTDTVFDGEHAPYNEDDVAQPVNYYGQTKVEAERVVKELKTPWVIARLAIVMGLPVIGSGNSFMARMLEALKEGQKVHVPARELRTPVDVITAGRALLELAAGDHEGIFHLAGSSRLERIELGRKIAARFGFPEELVNHANPEAMPRRAIRPSDVSLDNSKTRGRLKTPMRTIDEALSLILETNQTLRHE